MPQMSMQTPQDLFIFELSDILSAEQTIAQMLHQAHGLVQNPQLQQGLQAHEQETQQQIQNLQQIFQQMGAQPLPIQSFAAEGLMRSLQTVVESQPSPEVLEGTVVAAATKTEHLEIACYTGLVMKAQAMGQTQAAELLQQNLQQEQAQLQRVEQVAQQLTQQMASMAGASA